MTEDTSRHPAPRPSRPLPARRRGLGRRLADVLRSLFRIVELTARLIVSFVIVGLVILLLVMTWGGSEPEVKPSTALVLAPHGVLVEQLAGRPAERLLLDLLGQPPDPETLVRPLIDAIERATGDERVKVLVLDLDRLAGGGLSKLQDLSAAIRKFKESGKPVVAFSDFYFQSQYHLASQADEVFVNPMGMVVLQGYGSYRSYYKEAIDKIEAKWNVFRVGEYKSAVEPYLRNDMSPEARSARLEWLSDLWESYRTDVAAGRGLGPSALEAYVEDFHLKLEANGGDSAGLALSEGLVDHVAPRDQVRDRLIELAGEDEESGSFNRVDHYAYLAATEAPEREGEGVIAVVIAKGSILDGRQSPGTIGGDSTAALIREAREDDEVKAVVLRVDSPGGSAFASEIIGREIELTREAGKPVIASMGSVAASGGYWISMSADEIWAHETTITGSIGIFAVIPTFEQSLLKLGIHNDGVATHPLAGISGVDRDLPEEALRAVQATIEQGYRRFITKAAAGRGMTVEEVDRVARGRVWSGKDALEIGLVDRIGGLEDALAAAAERAELGNDYQIRYIEEPPSRRDQLLSFLLLKARPWLGGLEVGHRPPDLLSHPLVRGMADDLALLADPERPYQALAYCFCGYE